MEPAREREREREAVRDSDGALHPPSQASNPREETEPEERQGRLPDPLLLPRCPFERAESRRGRCYHYFRLGSCRLGDECKFLHEGRQEACAPPPAGGAPAGAPSYFLAHRVVDARDSGSLLRRTLEGNGMVREAQPSRRTALYWSTSAPRPPVLAGLPRGCRVLHFPRFTEATHKGRMHAHAAAAGLPFVPRTVVLPGGAAELLTCRDPAALRIWKPASAGEARGIRVTRGPATPEEVRKAGDAVVSRYVERPLLVGGRKCDMRLYVAVTSLDPLEARLHERGIVRFAGRAYAGAGVGDRFAHLTNNTVSRHAGAAGEGGGAAGYDENWPLARLWQELEARGTPGAEARVVEQLRAIVSGTLLACRGPMLEAMRGGGGGGGGDAAGPAVRRFELFGFDVLLDDELRAWLLEVNSMPDLSSSGTSFNRTYAVHHETKAAVLADLLNLVFFGDAHAGGFGRPV